MKMLLHSGGTVVANTVVDGVLYTLQGSILAYAQKRNTNYSNPKAATHLNNTPNLGAFPSTNAVVVQLDAAYDALADKSPWIDYATAIAGHWKPCVNCDLDTTAKKLYRVVNLNRLQIGLGFSDDPPTDESVVDGFLNFALFEGPPTSPTAFFQNWDAGGTATLWTVAQIGAGLANPVVQTTPADRSASAPEGSLLYGFYAEVAQIIGADLFDPTTNVKFPTCTFGLDGQPGIGLFPSTLFGNQG